VVLERKLESWIREPQRQLVQERVPCDRPARWRRANMAFSSACGI
jgi:hypothetical protein